MIRHRCGASRTIYVPTDPAIRMACVVQNHEQPHNHPILPVTKASRDIKSLFKRCIDAVGMVGATVKTIENGTNSCTVDILIMHSLWTDPGLCIMTHMHNENMS
jgi:hypothetical protein